VGRVPSKSVVTVPEDPPDLVPAPADAIAEPRPMPVVEQPAVAPSVVVVVVAHDPGWWFEETLASVAAQHYANTSVLVVDAASSDAEGLRVRVAAVLPGAHLRRLEEGVGFGAAANEALRAVQGAAFLLFCHDDVRLEPDVIQVLVEEAFRSNAGIVGPKLVDWHHADRLLQVGMGADRFGQASPYVERGDLDQSQHDAVRDAFFIPGAATLVRADLFEALHGFDPAITFLGDDLDLGWRAHVAGARVVVAPAARVAHLEALGVRRPVDDRRRLQARHRLRALRVADTLGTRLRTVPVAFVLALLEVLHSVVLGRFRHARDVASAWSWNISHASGTRARRRLLAAVRQVPDREVRARQAQGSARLSGYLRGQYRGDGSTGPRDVVSSLRDARTTTSVVVWTIVAVFLLIGSRELLWGSVPAIGQLAPFDSAGDMLARWQSGFDATGLGASAPNATGLGAFGGLGVVLLGATGVLRSLAILAPLLVGVLGMAHLVRPIGSTRSRLVAVVTYTAVPVATNALSTGRWAGIVAYGLAPWVLSALARSSGVAPYGPLGGSAGPGVRHRPILTRIVTLGLITALAAIVDPSLLLVLPICGVALVVGGLLAGQAGGVLRVLAVTAGGTLAALVLHLPWSLSFTDGWTAIVVPTSTAGQSLGLGAVLGFDTGPFGSGATGWLLLVAAALPLFTGRRWRVGWAVRAWAVAATGFGLAWLVGRGGWSFDLPAPELLLAPAAAGLALAVGLGMVAFEVDLPDYHFGWRQILSLLAGVAFVVAIIPTWSTVVSGRWELPRGDFERSLSFMRTEAEAEPSRALWLGDAGVLPGVGWALDAPGIDDLGPDRRLASLTSESGVPTVAEHWPGTADGATPLVADAVRSAAAGDTSRLGAILAPMGVRYVVVPLGPAPDPYAEGRRYDPRDLLAMLEGQLDLDGITVNPGVRVYRNAAWGPSRALLPPGTAIGDGGPGVTGRTLPELVGAPVALSDGDGVTDHSGSIATPSVFYLASGGGDRWSLSVDGDDIPRSDAFGWASSFAVERGGAAELTYSTPATRWLTLGGQIGLWILAMVYLLRVRVVEDEPDTLAVEVAPLAPAHVVLGEALSPTAATDDAPEAPAPPPAELPTMAVPVVVGPAAAGADESADDDPADDSDGEIVPPASDIDDQSSRRGRRRSGRHAR